MYFRKLFLTAFLALIIAGQSLYSGWEKLSFPNDNSLRSVLFLTSERGFTGGQYGTFYQTTDAGSNWSQIPVSGSNTINDIYFYGNTYGWAVGESGMIMRSTDAGFNWSDQTSGTTNTLNAVHFFNNIQGLAVGLNGTILRTTNGGTNWNVIASPTTADLYDLNFIDPTTGYAVGSEVVIKTTDGGSTWTLELSNGSKYYRAIGFFSSSVGFILGESGEALKTTNGGTNWSAYNFPIDRHLYSAGFINGNANGMATALDGALAKTTNSGSDWIVQYVGEDEILYDVSSPGSNTFYSVGSNGSVFKTTDGGAGSEEQINVTQPNGAEHLVAGSIYQIKWTHVNVNSDINIQYSTNNGTNWIDVASVPVTNLLYDWTIPSTLTNNALVRVSSDYHPGVFDASDDVFTIAQNNLSLVTPDGGEHLKSGSIYPIEWTSNAIANIDIEFSSDGGTNWSTIQNSVSAPAGSYNWTVPANHRTTCRVRLTNPLNTMETSHSNSNFSIVGLDITAPSDGAVIEANQSYDITWTSSIISNVDIKYSVDGGNNWTSIVNTANAALGIYPWSIPDISADIILRINESGFPDVYDEVSFSISNVSEIDLTADFDGRVIPSGTTENITWTSFNVDFVCIELTTDNGLTWTNIAANQPAANGTFAWTVNNYTSQHCRIRVYDCSNGGIVSLSDGLFEIFDGSLPVLDLSYPAGGEEFEVLTNQVIRWDSYLVTTISIVLSTDNGSNWIPQGSGLSASSGSWSWTVPDMPSSQCLIKIFDDSDPTLSSTTASVFKIFDPNMKITITSPNGGEQWFVGATNDITWTSERIDYIKLSYSTDGGATWKFIAQNIDATLGKYSWTAPRAPGTRCLVKITPQYVEDIYDISDAQFSIFGLDLIYPASGEKLLYGLVSSIAWRSAGVDNIRIDYSTDNGANWIILEESYSATVGAYSWVIPNTPSDKCLLRIMDTERSAISDQTTGVFEIKGLLLINPVDAPTWISGTTQNITWESISIDNIKIEYSTDSGNNWTTIISNTPAAPGTYAWTVPQVASSQCVIKLSALDSPIHTDQNDRLFTIMDEGILISYPNGAEVLDVGDVHQIKWTSINVNKVDIDYTYDNGITWYTIANDVDASIGSHNWVIPNTPSTECRIRITDTEIPTVNDNSNDLFRIRGGHYPVPVSWRFTAKTGQNAVIVVPYSINPEVNGRFVQNRDAIGLFYDRDGVWICAGYGLWVDNHNLAITVWGDNVRTALKDGFASEETYKFKVWDAAEGLEMNASAEYLSGPDNYAQDAISILSKFTTFEELRIFLPGLEWSLISQNLEGETTEIETLLSDIREPMDYMKDDNDGVYYPDENINTISEWDITNGYQIYMNEDAWLVLRGVKADPEEYRMSFDRLKWYLISYLPDGSLPVATALARMIDSLLMVKNGAGEIYFPQYGIDQIGTMNEGEGYKIASKINIYNFYYPDGPNAPVAPPSGKIKPALAGLHYSGYNDKTGNSSVLVIESPGLNNGDEIGVYTNDNILVGSAVVADNKAVVTIWGNNRSTAEKDGAGDNESLNIRYFNTSTDNEYTLDISYVHNLVGKAFNEQLKYIQDAITIMNAAPGSILGINDNPEEISLSCSPNPASENIHIVYKAGGGLSRFELSDNLGNIIYKGEKQHAQRGSYSLDISALNIPSGVYHLRYSNAGRAYSLRVVVLK